MASPIEAGGYIFIALVIYFKLINWKIFIALCILVYCFAVFLSVFAIFTQQVVYFKIRKKKDLASLVLSAFMEPVVYHPRTVWWALRGNFDKIFKKKKTWGTMTRKGFKTPAK